MASKASIMWQVEELLQRAWPYPEVFAAQFRIMILDLFTLDYKV